MKTLAVMPLRLTAREKETLYEAAIDAVDSCLEEKAELIKIEETEPLKYLGAYITAMHEAEVLVFPPFYSDSQICRLIAQIATIYDKTCIYEQRNDDGIN